MDSFLRLTFTSDDDGTGELHAQVSCNGFSGRSRAWFSLPQLETFAAEILRFPLPLEGTTSLRGGYWSRERKGELEQLHLSLRLYPWVRSASSAARLRCAPRYNVPLTIKQQMRPRKFKSNCEPHINKSLSSPRRLGDWPEARQRKQYSQD
jgi:hypothetical protein